MPQARAFWPRRMIDFSTSSEAIIMRSANSSMMMNDKGHGFIRMKFIIAGNIPRMGEGKALIAVIHFANGPAQDAGSLLGIGDDRRQ